jgi:chorismate mutase / prephenate dehydratase
LAAGPAGPLSSRSVSQPEDTAGPADLRRQVDDLDTQIVELLAQRTELARAAGRDSQGQDTALFGPAREAEILTRLAAQVEGRMRADQLRAVYREVLSAAREVARPLRIAFLGDLRPDRYQRRDRH